MKRRGAKCRSNYIINETLNLRYVLNVRAPRVFNLRCVFVPQFIHSLLIYSLSVTDWRNKLFQIEGEELVDAKKIIKKYKNLKKIIKIKKLRSVGFEPTTNK